MTKKPNYMSQEEIDYENEPVSQEAIQAMRDRQMSAKNEAAYKKAREYSLGSPDKPKAKSKKMAKGGCVGMAKGGTASKRADGCAVRGKTKGRMV
jgi:hypothetical protein